MASTDKDVEKRDSSEETKDDNILADAFAKFGLNMDNMMGPAKSALDEVKQSDQEYAFGN